MEDQHLAASDLARQLASRPRKPRRLLKRRCLVCGKEFESARTTRMYCSNACAQRAFYYRQKATPPSVSLEASSGAGQDPTGEPMRGEA